MMKFVLSTVMVFAIMWGTMSNVSADWGDALKLLEKGSEKLIQHKDAFIEINEPREIELGEGMSAQLLGAAPLVDNRELQQYVNDVGLWLALQTERPDLPWHFGVLDDNDINAFAAPGGYIFISKGLFMLMRNESELAGVLAHEISHVLVKHHLEDIREKAQSGILKDIGSVAAEELAGPEWQQVARQLINTGVDVWESGLNRDDELEADQLGVVIAARAGYDPYGLVGVLHTLSLISPQAKTYQLMHATHPPAMDRVERLEQAMQGQLDKYSDQVQVTGRLIKLQQLLEDDQA